MFKDETKYSHLMTPKSIRLSKKQNYENIEQKLKQIPFNNRAVQSGFKQRKEKKITGKTLLIAFIFMAMKGKNSFQHWAEQVSIITGASVSKQGIWKKMSARLTGFLALILFDVLQQQVSAIHKQAKQYVWLKKYKRILLQDSTVIALPSWLSWCFPGNVSKGEKKAQLKIQVVYDLRKNHFVYFEITPYTTNDQSQSKEILNIATVQDLVIRDLGYFVLESFNEMNCKQISYISRLRYGVTISDTETGKEIHLLKHLKKRGEFDGWVLLGKEQKLKVRLVAQKLPQEQAAHRIRKAKSNGDKRLNHSKEYDQMLGYNLFITTEGKECFSTMQIAQLYKLRWRIETIFKCWKSNFHLQKLIPQHCSLTKERVEAIIYMMLIFILLFQVTTYNAALFAAEKMENCCISLLRLCKYIANNIDLFFEHNLNAMMPQILYYCRYDKRYDRQNFVQKIKLG